MVQNAVQFAAKRKLKWCKTQCKMVLNARQKSIEMHCNGINITFRAIKNIAKKGKIAIKKWDFRGKKQVNGA